ncbi:MAG: hypothetical protein ACTH2Q_07075 [Propionibacteriaceae bacterium]
MSLQHPVRREDGETVGFVAETPDGWVPTTVFGHPVGAACDRDDAERHLRELGMSYLAETWELAAADDWIAVQIVEASPQQVTVSVIDMGHTDRYGERHVLVAPVGTALRLR